MNTKEKYYLNVWGNFKSDKNKTKASLREEIRDILIYGEFSKEQLIQIKDKMKKLAWET